MTKTLERALAEIALIPEAEQDRIGRELLADMETRRTGPLGISEAARPLSRADRDWLAANRVERSVSSIDAGTLVSRMRDEDWR
jgi:hypothetical protein